MANDSCFVPDPKFTFYFQPSYNIICAICHDTQLYLSSESLPLKDSDPSVLPCGHVFGHECLTSWLRSHNTCPVCRFELKFELCPHRILPRRLTRENVFLCPLTVPDGGKVKTQCAKCTVETGKRVYGDIWKDLVAPYYTHKRDYERTGDERYKRLMEGELKLITRVMSECTNVTDREW
ncbi:uncharacterized protein CTHT_0032440 [Thermochaetoides thermophila DSM 1495]|uniref:RING-type domain-containing protein n=1 Tax=Chaetomium thermophilum (strain DSM 1495 / CBS 144.50 / IMI 039719) TaxID=759272 RepID=G0S568_CHATD|nr:hypothetical protein CTHT_0032440 [Thermochaetoides thermophila DSM 1495]EGS21387.1 hypothetical protein CTHT_0032440 [Thermochaetoides thermophila DSM 1495]